MRKHFITFLALCFALIITAGIHAAINKINPIDSPFKLWLQIWFGVGLLYFLTRLIAGKFKK